MIYHRCACGKSEYFESGMPPQPCQGCSECGTTYATNPLDHRPREPHDWEERWKPGPASAPPVKEAFCKRCYARRKDELPPTPL